jgi:hypothetical protein
MGEVIFLKRFNGLILKMNQRRQQMGTRMPEANFMMHEHFISRPDEIVVDINSVMCLFWHLEANSSALYQQMAMRETCRVRADGWRRLQEWRLLVGESQANHSVYVSEKLLAACRDAIRQGWVDFAVDDEPFYVMTRIMELKFLQVMLITALRQQTSLVAMVDVDKFGTSVAFVTRLVLSSRGR